jgi:hypothetical protein
MKVGDKVQYCGYDTLGATGEIIRVKAHGHLALERHLKINRCEFEWSHEDDGDYLAVDMDGQFDENKE